MRSHHLLAITAAMLASPAMARAQNATWTLPGNAFSISGPCAAHVTIEPGRAGDVRVTVAAAHAEEIARLAFDASDGAPSLHPRLPSAACWRPEGDVAWTPTLTVAVEVPPGARLQISDAGQSSYRIGAVGGALAVELAGQSTLEAAAAAATSLDLSGETRLALHHVAGSVMVDASGQSSVRIEEIEAPSLSLGLSGLYDVTTGAGSVGSLAIDASGKGTVMIGGTTGSADVSASGAASVRIAHLTGPIQREVSGIATVDAGP